jgi:pilus assembly protein CpaC
MRTRVIFVRTALVCTLLLGVAALQGQTPPAAPQVPPVVEPEAAKLALTVGRSRVLLMDFDITRVSITNPAVADVTVVDTRELLIDGKSAGTVSLIVWGSTNRIQYDVVVDPGVSGLQRQLQTIFPGEQITAHETPETVILTGRASNNTVMLRVGELATAMVPKAKIINLIQLPGGNGSQQVMLQVRVAEVNRRAVT